MTHLRPSPRPPSGGWRRIVHLDGGSTGPIGGGQGAFVITRRAMETILFKLVEGFRRESSGGESLCWKDSERRQS
jgi:uncharacterized membrane protein